MSQILDYPAAVLVVCFLLQWLALSLGAFLRKRPNMAAAVERTDFGIVLSAQMTLLALIIGFTFSMAVSRYDLRHTYEEGEANAIGTEYARADLLPPATGDQVRRMLVDYVRQRILDYETQDGRQLEGVRVATARLQTGLWSTAAGSTAGQQTPVQVLVASGMNDVLNSQGYAQAAEWNRIPFGAWALLILVAVACNLLLGLSQRKSEAALIILPLTVSVCFFLIADIDSPRHGIIRVIPENLFAVAKSIAPG